MAKTPQEQVSDLANGMINVLLDIEGVKGIVVTIDWDNSQHPHLGCFRVKETSLGNILDLLKRTALMQSHMLTQLNRLTSQTAVVPKKEEPPSDSQQLQPKLPGSPGVGQTPA